MANLRKYLWPTSLSGQLIGLLVLAIVFAQGVSLWVFHDERRIALVEVARDNILMRAVATVKLLEETPDAIHGRILDAGRSRFSSFWIDDTPIAKATNPSNTELRLISYLQKQFDQPRNMQLDLDRRDRSKKKHDDKKWDKLKPDAERWSDDEKPDGVDGKSADRKAWEKAREKLYRKRREHVDLALSIQLPDGSWFNANTDYRPPQRSIAPFLVQMLLTIVATSVIVALLMRRISKPLRQLAGAAEKLGRGESIQPLDEKGPAEIAALTRAFNDMQNRLTRFVQDRTRMLAAISHDMRTPITSLRLRAEFIEDDENREKIIETLDEMSQMTEATLAFARDEATSEDAQKLDLGSLLTSLADDQQDLGHNVTAEDHGRLVIRCRPFALKRALRNLIDNGVSYGEAVCLSYADINGHALIRVRDKGPGIPTEKLTDVFEPFVRLEESRSEETGGIGLGLAITRSIIHAHGGTITLSNSADGGLLVEVKLPLGV
ncbi:HAMP domain-containing protein [Roseibium sp. CAU 1637]|uniref:histidine kinase n=1 Tax=Roseibium limicola TaxID=2816037 RepID=A0A939EQL5_9HYPH|nr:HAMP domain-containing protein [Roseibium limicola]